MSSTDLALTQNVESRVMAGTFRIPADLDDDGVESLQALAIVRTGSAWATAAAVYAWTEPGTNQHDPPGKSFPGRLSISAFADLGLRGLSSRPTVRRYRRAWAHAVERGWAEPAEPGASVTLPDRDFEFAPERREVPGGAQDPAGNGTDASATDNGGGAPAPSGDPAPEAAGAARDDAAPSTNGSEPPAPSSEDAGEPEHEDHEPDPLAEWERAEEELGKALELIEALQTDDTKRELAKLHEKYARLDGRLQQVLHTKNEAERTARYAKGKLKKVRAALEVERDRDILPAIEALR